MIEAEAETAWAAGFMEGRGRIAVRTTGDRPQRIAVRIRGQEREPLQRFARAVGFGRVVPYKNNGKSQWEYRVEAKGDAVAVLRLLRPFFGPSRAAATDRVLTALDRPYVSVATGT